MKNRTTSTLVTLIALAAAAGVPAAHAHGDPGHYRDDVRSDARYAQRVDARQERQRERIQVGLHTGHLTRAEFHELMAEQHRIRRMERHFRADDGRIDAGEFRRLEHALDRASDNIRAERRDRQVRLAAARPWQD